MSLHDLANQVQSAGRNDDKVLVHMTPGEVKGLQSIAMAHGGSLTINPQTGLPEAGFLSSILPMVAGLGLSMIPGVGPMMAAGIVGGGTAIATGDLKKGLMAGLGAYGGAGLGAGLTSMGAQGAAASSIDDIALASKNAAANSQIGGAYGNVAAAPTQVFGAPNLATTATPNITNMGVSLTDDLAAAKAQLGNSYSSVSSVPAARVNPTVVTGTSQPSVGFNQSFNGRLTSDYMPQSNFNVGKNLGATGAEGAATTVPTQTISRPFTDAMNQMGRGAKEAFSSTKGLGQLYDAMPQGSVIASGLTLAEGLKPEEKTPEKTKSLIRPYEFSYNPTNVSAEPYSGSAERTYFNPVFTAKEPYEAPGAEYAAMGGLMGYAAGGPIEDMAAMNAVGANTGYPMANLQTPMYSNPAMQRPEATNVVAPSADAGVSSYSGELRFARGGMSHLGDYSDGGRLLKGPGDGVSDSIPAVIGQRQPARLADGEFVVPARIVSELGNGSTQAGARKLYAMMDRVQNARKKSVGKKKVAVNSRADKYLPA
jgi:hypothetical protein